MKNSLTNRQTTRHDVPLPSVLTNELVAFWEGIFYTPYSNFHPLLAGAESSQNRDLIYVTREGTKLAGTCHLTISQSVPELGGCGEVGTASEFRRMGIASTLCEQACSDFRDAGGQALFLGTVNAEAARVYMRLGWRKFAGTNVMGFISDARSPETFLFDYFRQDVRSMKVTIGSANDRIPMIPLLISPHNWQVMDANTEIFSTRQINQNSCMGLYSRYERISSEDRGTWFGVRNDAGCLCGLSTSRLDDFGQCQVDGFTHPDHPSVLPSLLDAATVWASSRGVTRCWVRISIEDKDKTAEFEKLGFCKIGYGEPFDINQKQIDSLRLQKDC